MKTIIHTTISIPVKGVDPKLFARVWGLQMSPTGDSVEVPVIGKICGFTMQTRSLYRRPRFSRAKGLSREDLLNAWDQVRSQALAKLEMMLIKVSEGRV